MGGLCNMSEKSVKSKVRLRGGKKEEKVVSVILKSVLVFYFVFSLLDMT